MSLQGNTYPPDGVSLSGTPTFVVALSGHNMNRRQIVPCGFHSHHNVAYI